jgi:hypothetical protein
LLERLRTRCDRVLVYAYDDWIDRSRDLRSLTEAAGLAVADGEPDARVVLAAIGDTHGRGPR